MEDLRHRGSQLVTRDVLHLILFIVGFNNSLISNSSSETTINLYKPVTSDALRHMFAVLRRATFSIKYCLNSPYNVTL